MQTLEIAAVAQSEHVESYSRGHVVVSRQRDSAIRWLSVPWREKLAWRGEGRNHFTKR